MAKTKSPQKKSINPVIIGFAIALLVLAFVAYQMMSATRQPTSLQDEDWDMSPSIGDSTGDADDVDIDDKIEEPIKPDVGAADPVDHPTHEDPEAHDTEQWKANSGPLKGKAR